MARTTQDAQRDDAAPERRAAHAALVRADPALAALVAAHGPVDPYVWPGIPLHDGDLLEALVLHIVGQQISVRAALAIFGRLVALLGGRVSAPALATATDDELRGVGLSGAKARAVHELGEGIVAGDVDLEALRVLDDAETQDAVTRAEGWRPFRSYAAAHLWRSLRPR